jgi:hypothetical protein
MPLKSQAQRRFLHSQHPQLAKKFDAHTPKGKQLPEKVKSEELLRRIDNVLTGSEKLRLGGAGSRIEHALDKILTAEHK